MGAIEITRDLLSNYLSSKDEGTNAPNLSSYTSACEEDPELKSFGQRFNKLKNSLAPGGITENLPLLSVKTLCWFLVEVSQSLAENIIANKDVLENEELRSLVDLYYESSTKTLDLFNTVGASTKKAELSIVIIRIAIKQFEKESMTDTDLDHGDNNKKKKKYEETLEELKKVKAMGDPFGEEYKNQLESVRAEQLMVLDKFHKLVAKLDAKKEELKKRRRLVTIVYASAALSFLAVEAIVGILAPPLWVKTAATVATGLNYVVGTVGLLVHEMLRGREKDLDREKEVVDFMVDNTKVNIQGTNTINSLVEKLIASLSLILKTAEIAVVKREEEAVKPVMETILREVETLAKTIQEVGEAVATCSTCVTSGKVKVLEHISYSVSSKGK